MQKKNFKIVGLNKKDFDLHVKNGELKLRSAHLIPTTKIGDEIALTSVLLSSLKLIKEFRRQVQSDMKMSKSGKIYTYTEVQFPDFPEARVDGLMILVQGGIIKDACILEMKNGSSLLEIPQIEKYLKIAKHFSIPKLVTVSNQYVSKPSQSPLNIKPPKGISMTHFSWSYLLTISHLLLHQNDNNIADEDQVEIMKEVVNYFEYDKSGVCGFTQMKAGWTKTIEKINSGSLLCSTDILTKEAVMSWLQEEQDLALMLSRELGVLVTSGEAKFKSDYQKRYEHDMKSLVDSKHLHSTFQIAGAVSEIKVVGLLEKRAVEMSVNLKVPKDKTLKGQVGWIRKQLETCAKKTNNKFSEISDEIFIDIFLKNSSKSIRIPGRDVNNVVGQLKGREIRSCNIVQLKDFGKMFSSRTKFVSNIESMALNFYSLTVQHLKNWNAPAPKLNHTHCAKKTVQPSLINNNVEAETLESEKPPEDSKPSVSPIEDLVLIDKIAS